MQVVVGSVTNVSGPGKFEGVLEKAGPRDPFFGRGTFTPEAEKLWREFYKDVAVVAFRTPKGGGKIEDVEEKALYYRAPHSSQPGVKAYLGESKAVAPKEQCIASAGILDLTAKMDEGGRLVWDVPEGEWTILRFGRRLTGQMTRPAPAAGLGLETNKFERGAIERHLDAFVEPLVKEGGETPPLQAHGGLTDLHFDSWEMSSQNWSESFRAEFKKRRGYDPVPWLPVVTGRVVDSVEKSERFLWDLRQTAQELVIEHQMSPLKERARKYGLSLSVEPYDMNPCSDLELGAVADVPMCEFWSKGFGFATEYSCIEAVSIGHTNGKKVIGAEAFTSGDGDKWLQHPASMKAQANWAFAAGINRLVIHRFQHQPTLDERPGMTMGIYGVHWDRTQTWWPMVGAFHNYLSRCQYMLRQGLPVADILYLAREGAPNVFRAPGSAMIGELPDRRGYNFDACAPGVLIREARVRDGRITFSDGMSYAVLVLPSVRSMTPRLLEKIESLIAEGATVIVGAQPTRSPSLSGYPECDERVRELARGIWGDGRVVRVAVKEGELYPEYERVAEVLALKVLPDFLHLGERLRYSHRRTADADIYFVACRNENGFIGDCVFRVSGKRPEWWDPMTGTTRELPCFEMRDGRTAVPLRLDENESGFVVFRKSTREGSSRGAENFPNSSMAFEISGPWEVEFDEKWGGPGKVKFERLENWAKRSEEGIRFYSGSAVYRNTFDRPTGSGPFWLGLGDVKNMASVRINGKEIGVTWCAPWRLEIPAGLLKERDNTLEITVANLWCNRLIGDAGLPVEKRVTRTTWNPFKADSTLQPSGLLGPVVVEREP